MMPGTEAWMADAACADADIDLFFPTRGRATAAAKTICDSCPVRPDCLDYAVTNSIEWGVWGGMSQNERRVLIRERRRRLPGGGCGTTNGYQRHRRVGDTPCAQCRAAWALAQRESRLSA